MAQGAPPPWVPGTEPWHREPAPPWAPGQSPCAGSPSVTDIGPLGTALSVFPCAVPTLTGPTSAPRLSAADHECAPGPGQGGRGRQHGGKGTRLTRLVEGGKEQRELRGRALGLKV